MSSLKRRIAQATIGTLCFGSGLYWGYEALQVHQKNEPQSINIITGTQEDPYTNKATYIGIGIIGGLIGGRLIYHAYGKKK